MIQLSNKNGSSVWLTEIGAGIVSVVVPDRNGIFSDVVLGYTDRESYFYDGPCSGKIPGRFANRIANGKFELDGKSYQLAINNGPNHLHGGPEGFSNKVWEISCQDSSSIAFSLTSPDGDENYPGEIKVNAVYRWSDDNVLSLEITATTDKATVVNLTNHAYWNLAGEDSGSILSHELEINASNWLPTDDTLIPIGTIASVEGTPMDFRVSKEIGRDIKADFDALKFGKGYDNCWIIDGGAADPTNTGGSSEKALRKAAVLSEKKSGRILEVYTTQPAAQVYTGNWLAGSPISKSGRSYNDYDGVAIECQGLPDSPNQPNFPSTVLRPGEEYKESIEFRFLIK